jgi:glycosyltransferase involved in cell wall biosynthesis
MSMAREAIALAQSLGLEGRHVFFNFDWVHYEERRAYFAEADLGVSAHMDSIEVRFAFRTRLLDHFAALLPSVVTAGDVLSDVVAERGLGRVVGVGDVDGWAAAVAELLDDAGAYAAAQRALREVRSNYEWQNVVKPLERLLELPGGRVRTNGRAGRMVVDYVALAAGQSVLNPRLAVEVARRRGRG